MPGYVMRDSIPASPVDMRRCRLRSLPSVTRRCRNRRKRNCCAEFEECSDARCESKTVPPAEAAIVAGTVEQVRTVDAGFHPPSELQADAFALISTRIKGQNALVITGATDRAVLYGAFALLRKIAQGESISALNEVQVPSAPVRWVNQWDNLDGSIERGYAGQSIFFENRSVRPDLTRAAEYARLLASVGINGCNVSNVNADLHILDPDFIPQLARIADVFRPYGVQLGVAVNVSMPKQVGGLDTFDPLDPKVAEWWKKKFDEVYRQIPDFGGVVVKADSEGQLGPSVYGRNPAEAANVIAKALKPHGGIVFYRAFVYDHHLDWNNLKADRARAAYDIFHPLDGQFDDNVIVQIKHGPIDFQVREPVSPLFGGLEKTNEAIEVQITQEYTGQQRHTVFLVPMWKEVLDFDMAVNGRHTPVKDIVAGREFSSAAWRIRRRCERWAEHGLAGQPISPGEFVRIWPAGMESGPDGAGDRRGMDEADVWQRSGGRENGNEYSVGLVACVRELYGPARVADADEHHGAALRAGAGISRAQRLGPVDPGRP